MTRTTRFEGRVRPAELTDAATITEFNRAMAFETEQVELDPTVVSAGVAHLLAAPADGRYFVAEEAGALLGQLMITFEWSDWRNGRFWWIQSVYVVPHDRGRGVYRALHDHVALAARAAPDACGLRLYVERNNQAAQAVYGKVGLHATAYELWEQTWPTTPPEA